MNTVIAEIDALYEILFTTIDDLLETLNDDSDFEWTELEYTKVVVIDEDSYEHEETLRGSKRLRTG